jgi:hypothetical protein
VNIRPLLLCMSVLAADAQEPRFTLGDPEVIPVPPNPVRYYANDSRFPYLLNSNGTAMITFWVCGANFRSEGPDLAHMGPIAPTNAVLTGDKGAFDNGGAWLLNAIRRPDGVVVAFYHAEDHRCTPYTEWNSMGVALSRDDGFTFTKLGQVIGSPNPCRGFGGLAANTAAWDEARKAWLAWGGSHIFTSTDPDAAPGTWRGCDTNGAFTVEMPCTNLAALGHAPGLDGYGPCQSATWNTHLQRYLMVTMRWGDTRDAFVASSPDGLRWTPHGALYRAPEGEEIAYPFILGETGERSGREAWLVYMRGPGTQPGQRRDLVRRPLRIAMNSATTE